MSTVGGGGRPAALETGQETDSRSSYNRGLKISQCAQRSLGGGEGSTAVATTLASLFSSVCWHDQKC